MPKIPLMIRCTTCDAKLIVRNAALIGHVLACPKCGSMVHIEAPKDEPEVQPSDDSSVNTPLPVPSPPPHTSEPDDNENEPTIRSRMYQTKEQRLRKTTMVALLSIIVILALVYVAVLMNSTTDSDEENILVAQKPVDLPQVPDPVQPQINETITPDDETVDDPQGQEEFVDESVDEFVDTNDPEFVDDDTEQPAAPIPLQPIRKIEPINVAQRLKLPISSTRIDRVSLISTVRTLGDFSGIPLTIDVPGLRLHGINIREPVRMDFGGSTVADVLLEILTKSQLEFNIEYGQITIYPAEKDDLTIREIRYDITDVVRAAENSDQKLSVTEVTTGVRNLVQPQSWTENDSEACSIASQGTVLVVKQTAIGHVEVLRLLEHIRLARNLPLKTQTLPNLLNAERLGWEMIRGPLTLHYYTKTPVADLFEAVERFTGLQILLDNKTLNEMQIPLREMQGTVNIEKGDIKQAIEQILNSVELTELTYRIVDYDMVFITTLDAAALPENFSLESHYYGKFLANQSGISDAADLAETMMKTIEPRTWSKDELGYGAIFIDPVSQTFFVRQSQPVQRAIRNWLDSQENHEPFDLQTE